MAPPNRDGVLLVALVGAIGVGRQRLGVDGERASVQGGLDTGDDVLDTRRWRCNRRTSMRARVPAGSPWALRAAALLCVGLT